MKCSQLLFVKVSLIAVVLVYLVSTAHCKRYKIEDGSHNITMGHKKPNHQLIFWEKVRKKAKLGQKVSGDIRYKQKKKSHKYSITYYKVEDLGEGGYAYHTSGGIGQEFVSFHLESQQDKGYAFNIEVYGFRKNISKQLNYNVIM